MSGNVWEWCLNEYERPERVGLSGEARRVVRGGSWYYYRGGARASCRGNDLAEGRDHDLGLRVVWWSPGGPELLCSEAASAAKRLALGTCTRGVCELSRWPPERWWKVCTSVRCLPNTWHTENDFATTHR